MQDYSQHHVEVRNASTMDWEDVTGDAPPRHELESDDEEVDTRPCEISFECEALHCPLVILLGAPGVAALLDAPTWPIHALATCEDAPVAALGVSFFAAKMIAVLLIPRPLALLPFAQTALAQLVVKVTCPTRFVKCTAID